MLLVSPGQPPGHALLRKAQVPSARGIAKPRLAVRAYRQ